jgi:3',5'-cyclic AMP phosphodiesterase CpdA
MGHMPARAAPRVFAVSDLHAGYAENREILRGMFPGSAADWIIVAGDVGERISDIEWALRLLRERFARVVWAPGNHELWTHPADPITLRGEERYRYLIDMCRRLGVITPEDPYPVWDNGDVRAMIVPLFLLYDYTFFPPGTTSKEAGLARAYETGVVCTDEALLHPDPYPSRDAWCRARVAATEQRLAGLDPGVPKILVNHFPLLREQTQILTYPEFAQWCGTTQTRDWHVRFNVEAVVYGHLHIPRTTWSDGVRFEEVSLGYPKEWQQRSAPPRVPRQILPYREDTQ